MKIYAKILLIGTLLLYGMQAERLYAIPANPAPMVKVLPDGTTMTVRLCGDESFHYYMTEDGYPLQQDSQGFFYYARIEGQTLVRSSVRASDKTRRTAEENRFVQMLNKEKLARELSVIWREKRSNSKLKAVGQSSYPTKGQQRALAILVEFPKIGDSGNAVTFTIENPRQTFEDMLNMKGFDKHGATGSVHDYYYDNSMGQFNLTFDVFGPITLKNDISYYGTDELNAWEMVLEACQQLDAEVDFTQYDRNKDGIIDNVYIFYAGQGEANGGAAYTVWQHASDIEELTGNRYLFDGVRLNHYACSNEIRRLKNPLTGLMENTLEGIGTVCHEFTHVLGFPDLYNTKDQMASFTPGAWSLMDTGSYNNNSHTPPCFSAYERYCMGWIDLKELDAPEDVILDNISKNTACRISTVNEEEFFVLENRQKQGWDEYIPGHGMLIWHVAYDAKRWELNQVNTIDDYQYIDIEEADNLRSEITREGDAFPGTSGVTSFTDDTQPGMMTLDNRHRTNVPITHIEERNGFIHFKVKGGKIAIGEVTVLVPTDVTPVSFVANWEEKTGATGYKLDVYSVNGQQVNEYVEGYKSLYVEETSCLVTGLQPSTTYYYRVKAVDADSESAYSVPVEVTTSEATFEYLAPVALAATGMTENSFVANWEALSGAEAYLLDVYTKEKGVADTLKVDFTDRQLPEGWRTDCMMYLGTSGYFGEALPSISMSADYNYIESPVLNENVRGISFWYRERNNPSGDNRLVLSGYVDNQWVEFDVIELDGTKTAKTAFWSDGQADCKIPENCRAVRITYRLIGKGALALDDIKLAYNDKLSPVFLEGWNQKPAGNGTSCTVSGLKPMTAYYYQVRGVAGETITVPSAEIMAVTGDATGISTAKTTGVHLHVANGVLTITCDTSVTKPVVIYDALGKIAESSEVGTSAAFVLPQKGIWFVKVGQSVYKVYSND